MDLEIIKNQNDIIAEFLNFTQKSYTPESEKMWCDEKYGLPVGELKFNTSWDWLMPVVEKIEALGYFCMINKWTSVYTGSEGERISITSIEGNSKIINTFQAVIKFIEWYNKN